MVFVGVAMVIQGTQCGRWEIRWLSLYHECSKGLRSGLELSIYLSFFFYQ